MGENIIECICGKKYEEHILKKHIKECSLFRKKFEFFDFKISKLLQQILYDKKNLFLVRFLFKRYIKIMNHKIKEYDNRERNNNIIINNYEYEETITPENSNKKNYNNINNLNYKPIILEQNNNIFKAHEYAPFQNLKESRNNINVLNKIIDFNEVKNKIKSNLSKNKKNIDNDKNNLKNNHKNFTFSNLFKKFSYNKEAQCKFCKSRIEKNEECPNLNCKEYYKFSCKKKLSCGHNCMGVNNEKYCPPCLEPKCINYSGIFNQNKDTCCQLCLEKLSSSPIVNLTCNHYIHYLCIINRLNEGQNLYGKKLSFNFIKCPVCDQIFECPSVPEIQNKIENYKKIYFKVGELIKLRLSYDNIVPKEEDHDPYKLYSFFLCYKCKQPYYIGKSLNNNNDNNNENFIVGNAEDCLCGKDSYVYNAKGGSFCEKHGFKFFEYKCRFCCKIASRFYSQIHFCEDCYANKDSYNNNFSKLIKECNSSICEFKGVHAPNGIEYCLGCFVCRIENIKKNVLFQIRP